MPLPKANLAGGGAGRGVGGLMVEVPRQSPASSHMLAGKHGKGSGPLRAEVALSGLLRPS